jgi:hypothetical protein
MLLTPATDPSPLVQTATYMLGVLGGYLLLVRPDEWQRAWQTIRRTWSTSDRD